MLFNFKDGFEEPPVLERKSQMISFNSLEKYVTLIPRVYPYKLLLVGP